MPLLDLVTASSLDEDYSHVAERRAHDRPPRPPVRPHRTAAIVVGIFGLLIVTAAVQTSRDAEVAEEGRAELIGQINERREDLRSLQDRVRDLREENTQLSEALQEVVGTDRTVSARLLTLRGIAGFAPVTGPGVRIRVTDSADGSRDGILRDRDLALLVAGLWSAGAEAIAVNGERLTMLGGIQNVGRSIHISNQPLVPPYSVDVIGNPNTLQSQFAESPLGQSWYSLRSSFGFGFTMENATGLSLPAQSRPQLRSAARLDDENAPKMEVAP